MPYQLIYSRRRHKTISLSINKKGEVVVRAPLFTPSQKIEKLLKEKEAWIRKRIHQQQTSLTLQQKPLSSLSFLSQAYPLTTNLSPNDPKILAWYQERGLPLIKKKATYFSQKLNVNYRKIKIKKVSSYWGKCQSNGDLYFNYRLLAAPEWIVDYVVAHELCHLIHPHHQKSFWHALTHLDSIKPTQAKKWLRQNHLSLF